MRWWILNLVNTYDNDVFQSVIQVALKRAGYSTGTFSSNPLPQLPPWPPAELISRVNRLLEGVGIFLCPKIVSQAPVEEGVGGGGKEAVFSPFLPKKRNWVTGLCFPEIVCCKINIVDKPKEASLYYLPFLHGG